MRRESCPTPEELRQLLRGALSEEQAEPLERHFAVCSSCGELAAALEGPRQTPHDDWPPSAVVERLVKQLERLSGDWDRFKTWSASRRSDAESATTFPDVPGYEILAELGRGGMGVVYQARQTKLGRVVALKMLLAGRHAGREDLARFHTEVEAVARLQHPHIVQVHEVGEHDGRPYCALEFCPGGSLERKLNGSPVLPRQAAEWTWTLARAMDAAHRAQVIHRDLKPANVLLSAEGTLKIMDFGLARKLDEARQTSTGAVMGTPSYMAPEQAEGKNEVGPAADVWALGAILYDLLTGRPPFKAATSYDTIRQVLSDEPVPPRRLNPRVPVDLETICLKCLHKQPGRRYSSAAELADDCGLFLAGKPIQARPVGWPERAMKWVHRRPAQAALGAVVLLAVAVVVGLTFWFSVVLAAARGELEAEEARSQSRARLAEMHEFFGLQHAIERRSARPEAGWTWANLADLEKASRMDLAGDHLLELRREAASALFSVDVRLHRLETPQALGQPFDIQSLAFHPQGRWLAVGQARATGFALCHVALIDPQGKEKPRLLSFSATSFLGSVMKTYAEGVSALAFSPDGRWLVGGTSSGTLHCWDLASKKPTRVSRPGHTNRVDRLIFSRDGSALFSTGRGGTLKRWSFPGLEETAGVALGGPATGLAAHPRLGSVWCSAGGKVRVLSDFTLQRVRPDEETAMGRLVFSPDGRILLFDFQGRIHLSEGHKAVPLRNLTAPGAEQAHDGHIGSLAFSPDGALILSASDGKQVRVWETASGRLLADLPAEGENPQAVFHPNGRSLAVAAGQSVRICEIGGLRGQTFVAGQPLALAAAALHPDGRSLACLAKRPTGGDHEASVWSLKSFPLAEPIAVHTLRPDEEMFGHSLALAPDSQTLVLGRPGAFTSWGPGGEQTQEAASTGWPEVNALSFGPDGRLWAAVGGSVQVRSGPLGRVAARWSSEVVRRLTGASDPICLAAGRRWVAAGGNNGRVYLLRSADAAEQAVVHVANSPVRTVALSSDEQLIAAGGDGGELRLLRMPTGDVAARMQGHHDRVTATAFAGPTLLASGSRDRTVKLWDCTGGQLRELLSVPTSGPVRWLGFHPDGVRLFVLLDRERAVRLWRLDQLWARLYALGLGAGLGEIQASPLPTEAARLPAAPPRVESATGPNGLRAELFADVDLHHCVKVRHDRQINIAWPAPPLDPLLPKERYSVRWTGWLVAPRAGRYWLRLECAGPGRLWLDGRLIVDGRPKGAFKQEVNTVLTGRPQSVRVEYVHAGGGAGVCLSWKQAGGFAQAPIPMQALFHAWRDAEKAKAPSGK